MKKFKAIIQAHDSGGAFVLVPFDAEKEFGSKRPKVKATFDGVEYRGTLALYGLPEYMLIILKGIRTKIGKEAGDTVLVTIEKDQEERQVVVPDDLMQAMQTIPDVLDFFEKLSYTHRKEYVRWIESAKRTETRERRLVKAIEMMQNKQKGI